MIRRSSSARSGLSLLEVILAFAIFLMGFAGITQLISLGHDRALDAAHQNTGTRLAQSKLAEVEAGIISVSAPSSGIFDESPGWNWEVQVLDSPTANVYLILVRVWNENNNRVIIELTQHMLDPTAMGTAAPAQPPSAMAESGTTP